MPATTTNADAEAEVLERAANHISDPNRFIPDNTARGVYPPKYSMGDVAAPCLATAPWASRWNASGAIWAQRKDYPYNVVRGAWDRFANRVARKCSVFVWCSTHSHEQQVAELRAAAVALAEAA